MTPAELIERAGFTDDDRDIGTSGLCAMFALALYRVTLAERPELVLITIERDGKPVMSRDGGYYWRHAAVRIDGRYYDIEGEQKLEWMFNNYVWAVPDNTEPTVVSLSPLDFIAEIKLTESAWDRPFYDHSLAKLVGAASPK